MGDAVPGNVTPILFKTPEGKQYWTSPKALLDSGLAHETLEAFETYLLHGAAISGLFALAMLGWAWFYFTRTGRGLGSNQFLRCSGPATGPSEKCGPGWPAALPGAPCGGESGSTDRKSTRLNSSH